MKQQQVLSVNVYIQLVKIATHSSQSVRANRTREPAYTVAAVNYVSHHNHNQVIVLIVALN